MDKTNEDLNLELTKRRRELQAYIKRTAAQYGALKKTERVKKLDELAKTYGEKVLHRNSISRCYQRELQRLNGSKHKDVLAAVTLLVASVKKKARGISPETTIQAAKQKKRVGRPAKYDDDQVIWWLQTLWVATNYVNEKLLVTMLPEWLPLHPDPNFPEAIKKTILTMSASSIERYIRNYKKMYGKRIYAQTKKQPKKGVAALVPIRLLNQTVTCCGNVEGDTVIHCGGTLLGTCAWTLNIADIHCHWTGQRAFLGKNEDNVLGATIALRARFPFAFVGYHTDQGNEFINEKTIEYFSNPKDFVTQTKGRAYKKNDQCRIEQRNWTHVRLVFGYERIDTQELVDKMNEIYDLHSLFCNHFIATRKLKSKIRDGSQYRRSFEIPETPYSRVMKDKTVSEFQKEKLGREHKHYNPYELKKIIDQKLKSFVKALEEQRTSTDRVPGDSSGNKEAA